MKHAARATRLCAGWALLLGAIGAAGCGASAPTSSHAPATTAALPAVQVSAAEPAPRVRILSPRAGTRAGSTVTVRVSVSGEPAGGALRVRYVLDRRLVRTGAARLTFRALAPGRHSLEVLVVSPRAATARTAFTVSAPRPAPRLAVTQAPSTVPAVPVAHTAPAAPQPTQTTRTTTTTPRAPAPATAPSSTPARTTPAPTPTTTSPPPAGGEIPQGGGGDGDGDNSGAPSDGDGST
jgi:hypothetical protein